MIVTLHRSNDIFYQSFRMKRKKQEDFFITFIKNTTKSNFFQVLVPGNGAYLQERVNRSTRNPVVLTSHPNHQPLSYRWVIDGKLSCL